MTAMRYVTVAALLGGLAGCAPEIPDSAAGVGFDNYDGYRQQREADLAGGGTANATASGSFEAPASVTSTTLSADGSAAATGDDTAELAAAAVAAARNSGDAPVEASPSNPAPVLNNPGISDENSFDAVSERESIESDAERIERNRELYRVVEPAPLPARENTGPNIVDYALNSTNSVGQSLYSRGVFTSENRALRNCAKYPSSDQAQVAFLANGGPEKDRLGLDPDGDGFACQWSPAPFRAVRNQ